MKRGCSKSCRPCDDHGDPDFATPLTQSRGRARQPFARRHLPTRGICSSKEWGADRATQSPVNAALSSCDRYRRRAPARPPGKHRLPPSRMAEVPTGRRPRSFSSVNCRAGRRCSAAFRRAARSRGCERRFGTPRGRDMNQTARGVSEKIRIRHGMYRR